MLLAATADTSILDSFRHSAFHLLEFKATVNGGINPKRAPTKTLNPSPATVDSKAQLQHGLGIRYWRYHGLTLQMLDRQHPKPLTLNPEFSISLS